MNLPAPKFSAPKSSAKIKQSSAKILVSAPKTLFQRQNNPSPVFGNGEPLGIPDPTFLMFLKEGKHEKKTALLDDGARVTGRRQLKVLKVSCRDRERICMHQRRNKT